MNDKFSRLILLLQASLKNKTEEKDNILNKKRKVASKLNAVRAELSEKSSTASRLRTDLKKYNRYYLESIAEIICIVIFALGELLTVGAYGFLSYIAIKLILRDPFDLLNILISVFLLTVPAAFFFIVDKNFIDGQKTCIGKIKEGRGLRKKYKYNKDIKKELELVDANVASLLNELNSLRDEETSLSVDLEDISSEIVKIKGKLRLAKDAFIQSSFKVQGDHIEEDLDKEYDESHIEEKVAVTDEGKRISFHPKQNKNE